jgi:hypothetical protein
MRGEVSGPKPWRLVARGMRAVCGTVGGLAYKAISGPFQCRDQGRVAVRGQSEDLLQLTPEAGYSGCGGAGRECGRGLAEG